jgi:hypothetical protein
MMAVSSLPVEYKHLVIRVMNRDFAIVSIPERIDCPSSFRTRAKAEDWLVANLDALQNAGVKLRLCLCCNRQFLSLGAHHRMCQPCRRLPDSDGMPVSFSYRRRSAAHV